MAKESIAGRPLSLFLAAFLAASLDNLRERFGQPHIVEVKRLVKEGSDLLVGESRDAASYPGDIKCGLVPFPGEFDEFIDHRA